MLEDDAVTAADDRALGHVDDAEAAVVGDGPGAGRRTSPSAPRTRAASASSRSPCVGAPGRGLVVIQPRRRHVGDLVSRLPRAQAVVDVLVAHAVRLVEQTRPCRGRRAGCTCTRRWRRASVRRRRPVPNRRACRGSGGQTTPARCALRIVPAYWMRLSGIQQLGAGDPGRSIVAAACCRQASQSRSGDHVGVEQDDVVLGIGGPQAAVDVDGRSRRWSRRRSTSIPSIRGRAPRGARGRWRRRRR